MKNAKHTFQTFVSYMVITGIISSAAMYTKNVVASDISKVLESEHFSLNSRLHAEIVDKTPRNANTKAKALTARKRIGYKFGNYK